MRTISDLEQQLLRDICADPLDLTPRKVYADWLADNGEEERAEFMSCLIRAHEMNFLSRKERKQRQAEYDALTSRAGSIPGLVIKINSISETWLYPLTPECGWKLRLGMVNRVQAKYQWFIDHGVTLTRYHPVRRIDFIDRRPRVARGYHFGWQDVDYDGPGYIPYRAELKGALSYDDLPAELAHLPSYDRYAWYRDRQQAEKALSLVILNHCRRINNLPELTENRRVKQHS